MQLSRPAAWLLLAVGLRAWAATPLTVCTEAAPEGFDAAQFDLAATIDAAALPLYDTLVRFVPGGTGRIEPALAQSWEASADGRVYTLQLRRGVKFHSTEWFHPTREMNADDVVFSFSRMNDKAHPAHAAAKAGFVYWMGMNMPSLVESVVRVDEHAVRFTLRRPAAPFLADIAIPSLGSIFSAEYGAQLLAAGRLEQLNTHPVGTGRFVFRSYQKDSTIRYGAHAGYWAGGTGPAAMVFAITQDADVRAQRFKAGECLAAVKLKAESARQLEGQPGVVVVRSTPLQTDYLALNTQRPYLNDRRFRRALWLALDKATQVAAVHAGYAVPAVSFLPPAMWSHDASLRDQHDPEAARRLIQASGYDGRELTLFGRLGGASDHKRAAELLQADWSRVGVRVRLQLFEVAEFYRRARRGEHDIAMVGWVSDNADPDNFFTPNLACASIDEGSNTARWCHRPFDALLDTARASADMARRTELYRQAQRLVYDEVPAIPLVHVQQMTALNRRVSGFVPSPFGTHDFSTVRMEP